MLDLICLSPRPLVAAQTKHDRTGSDLPAMRSYMTSRPEGLSPLCRVYVFVSLLSSDSSAGRNGYARVRPASVRCYPYMGDTGRTRAGRGHSRFSLGSQDSGAGVARAWRGRGAGYRPFLGLGGAGMARAWRGRGAGMSVTPG
eukprot:gene16742-biopygen9811